jgi:tripartite-type tricarboxylate transporter receptor subunit TctC
MPASAGIREPLRFLGSRLHGNDSTGLIRSLRSLIFAACALASAATLAAEAQYPSRPIRIHASEPGAQVDLVARQLAPGISASMGQPVIVENRPGFIAVENATRAQPDGYTIVMYASSVWISPLLQPMRFDPVKDLAPITIATNAPLFLFAHPSLAASNIKELIALAKAKPGQLNYGSSAAGTSNHLAAELFKSMVQIDVVRIPYKGTGPAAIGLMANQVQLMFGSAAAGIAQAKAGKLKVLGVGSLQPSQLAPDVPTIASTVPGYEAAALSCAWAPAGTPRQIVQRLYQEMVRVLNMPDIKQKLLAGGVETVATTPEKTAAYIKADVAKWAKLIKDTGIRAE